MSDGAVHIAAPWEPRDSLCGRVDPANVVPFDGGRPNGVTGCWTCLIAVEWMDRRLAMAVERVAEAIYRERYGRRREDDGHHFWDQWQACRREARAILATPKGDCPNHPRAGR